MLNIGICDDNAKYRDAIAAVCNTYFKEKGADFCLTEYISAEEILAGNESLDLLFLDIEMGGMSGIELKDRFWEEEIETRIIFVTSHQENMSEGYGDNVQGFLLKPIDEKALLFHLNRFYTKWARQDIVIETASGPISLRVKDIIYLKAEGNYVSFVTERGKYLCNEGITGWEEKLKAYPMYRVHRSYLVNLSKIEKTGKKIELSNGETISCARDKVTELKEVRMQYLADCNRMQFGGNHK